MARVSSLTRLVRSLPGDLRTLHEVAEELGVPLPTVWWHAGARPEVFAPSQRAWWGNRLVGLYDAHDVARIRAHLVEHRYETPRKERLWTADELRTRHNERRRARYFRERALQCELAGDERKAAAYRHREHRIRRALERQRETRERQVRRGRSVA